MALGTCICQVGPYFCTNLAVHNFSTPFAIDSFLHTKSRIHATYLSSSTSSNPVTTFFIFSINSSLSPFHALHFISKYFTSSTSPLSHSLSTVTFSLHCHILSPLSHSLSTVTFSLHYHILLHCHILSPLSHFLSTLTFSLHYHILSPLSHSPPLSHSLSTITFSLHCHILSPLSHSLSTVTFYKYLSLYMYI